MMDNELKAVIAEIEEELKGYMTTIGGGSVTEMLRRRTVLLERALAQLQGQWVSVGAELPTRFELVDAIHLFNGKLLVVNALLALDSKDRWCVGMSDDQYSGQVLYWKKRPSTEELC